MHRTIQVVVLLCLCSCTLALIRGSFPEAKAFTVKEGLQNMKATVTNGKAVCEFRFTTTTCDDKSAKNTKAEKKIDPKKRTDYSAIGQLNGKCFARDIGYWNYELCVGGKMIQKHGDDVYILGNYQERTKDKQLYTNGTVCNINGKNIVRKTTIKYMCAPISEIVNIQEPEPCSYSATFTHPSFCDEGLPFERYIQVQNGNIDNVKTSPYDHFILSLDQDADGKHMCTLSSTIRDLKPKATTCFSKFAIEIQNVKSTSLSEIIIRHSNRVDVGEDEYQVDNLKVSSDSFDGPIEYLRVRT